MPWPGGHRSNGGSGRAHWAWLFCLLALSYHLAAAPLVKDRRRDAQRKANGNREEGVVFAELKRIRESPRVDGGRG